jgi:hypothetical protein
LSTSSARRSPFAANHDPGVRSPQSPAFFFLWLIALATSFIVSCAPKHVEMPSFEGMPLEAALGELRSIKSVESVLSVEYEKNDGRLSGDAMMKLSDESLTLRVYYMGFLTGEITEEEGVIRSTPKLDWSRRVLFVDGLRNSFFWWNITDYEVEEHDDHYLLRNAHRRLILNRKTFMPVEQSIEVVDGEMLKITYDTPARVNTDNPALQGPSLLSDWYQSRIRIEFGHHVVRAAVKSYSFTR